MRAVAVSKVLLIGATVTLIVLLVNVSVSLATDSTSLLRWLAAPILGGAASAASAVAQARHPADEAVSAQERLLPRVEHRFSPRAFARRFGQRLGKTTLVGGLVLSTVVVGSAGAGGALTGQVGMGWVTGNENGSDRLVADTSLTTAGLGLSILKVEHTPHFTRVTVQVDNRTGGSVSLPVGERNCLFIGGDGSERAASPFRSDWVETLDDKQVHTGVITFVGHVPGDVVRARLTFSHIYAQDPEAPNTATVSGIPLRPPN